MKEIYRPRYIKAADMKAGSVYGWLCHETSRMVIFKYKRPIKIDGIIPVYRCEVLRENRKGFKEPVIYIPADYKDIIDF